MDSAKFSEAQQAYDAGDFRAAAKMFLASTGRGTAGNGAAYHKAGNALMRLRRHADAITVYAHALHDELYEKRGAVQANLGTAYVALGDLSQAIASFEAALAEQDYQTPYKAWLGIASAQMERGRAAEAAVAYRRAALDESNPNPGKSLVNLGLCFMALGRPSDAAEAYKAALGFDNYEGRGRALANLGQAYAAMGDPAEAVRAFEKATQLHGHELSPSAIAAFEASRAAITPARETVDGWVTGEIAPAAVSAGPAGWGTGDLAALNSEFSETSEPVVTPPIAETSAPSAGFASEAAVAAANLGFGDDAAVSEFFSRTESDMKVSAREARRAERASDKGGVLRRVLTGLAVVVIIAAALGAAYQFGFGWPTQSSTVRGLFDAYAKGDAVESYWVAVPTSDVKQEMAKVPPVKSFAIDGLTPGRELSRARVTVTPKQGSPMHYVVTLSREGVGWRVTGIEYRWNSAGD